MSIQHVLRQDYLIKEIISSISRNCDSSSSPYSHKCFHHLDPENPWKGTCLHARALAACASVSRQWSPLAIAVLWGRYAGYTELMNLVAPLRNLVDDPAKTNVRVGLKAFSILLRLTYPATIDSGLLSSLQRSLIAVDIIASSSKSFGSVAARKLKQPQPTYVV
jgi:hypothetical protein